MQCREVDQGGQHFTLEADSGFANAVATAENQLLDVFNAVLVTPENVDCLGNALMVGTDDRHFMVDAS